MAAFDFPSSPSVNQTYTANGVTWKWNGTMWMRVSGAGYLEKIEEGNSKVEVDDSGSGNVTVTTDGTEKLRIIQVAIVGLGTQTPNKNSWNKSWLSLLKAVQIVLMNCLIMEPWAVWHLHCKVMIVLNL